MLHRRLVPRIHPCKVERNPLIRRNFRLVCHIVKRDNAVHAMALLPPVYPYELPADEHLQERAELRLVGSVPSFRQYLHEMPIHFLDHVVGIVVVVDLDNEILHHRRVQAEEARPRRTIASACGLVCEFLKQRLRRRGKLVHLATSYIPSAPKAERTAFEKLLAARKVALAEEYLEDPAAAAKALAEVLEHKTCLLCYERHTSPDADRLLRAGADDVLAKSGASGTCSVGTHRAGSKVYEAESLCAAHAVIDAMAAEAEDAAAWKEVKGLWIAELDRIADEKYLRADEAGRAAIAAERIAYGEWLKAREAMLTVLYPDASVQALLAEAVRARVLSLCGTVPKADAR